MWFTYTLTKWLTTVVASWLEDQNNVYFSVVPVAYSPYSFCFLVCYAMQSLVSHS
jgi:hypothetical protein